MSLMPATPEALQLMFDGTLSMARIEEAGLRIDVPRLDASIVEVKARIKELEHTLSSSKEHREWARLYGNRMKLDSPAQLGHVIFKALGHRRNPFMRDKVSGKYQNNEASFEHLKLPFLKAYFEVRKLRKALATNLLGLKKETVDGFVHPFIDLYTAESYRSSSSRINFQNQPIRNKIISEIIRSCVIPRKGNELLEADYSTQEVRVAYCYNEDPKLLYDIENGDMHKDRAMELYMLTEEEMGYGTNDAMAKMIRYIAKNRFVFAQFYGDYYGHCAPNLWDAISLFGLTTADGKSLFEHLKRKGITGLGACDPECEPEEGTFEHHVMSVERRMWREVYTVYDQWKKDWWALYQRQGGVNTKTGFKQEGLFRRNQILCDPIQGSAFHCLLWTIINVQRELRRYKMKSKIVLQIHDSSLVDGPRSEREAVIAIIREWGLDKIRRAWKWIICDLGMEFEVCESNWFKKAALAA